MLTRDRLIKLHFEEREMLGQIYFESNGFILKPELGKWLFCAEHDGYIIATMLWIETELELATIYYQSTQKNLYLIKNTDSNE